MIDEQFLTMVFNVNILGLLINFFHHNWPSLLRLPFLEEFITPIVKATKGTNTSFSFYSLPEFEEWKSKTENWPTFRIKYYKGFAFFTIIIYIRLIFSGQDQDP